MPHTSGYYRTGSKEAKARTARIKERRAAAATPEGKAVIRERLLAKKKTKEAGMTEQEKRSAERKKVDDFMRRRNEQLEPRPSTPGAKPRKPKPTKPSIRHPFPSLTGPDGVLGRKK